MIKLKDFFYFQNIYQYDYYGSSYIFLEFSKIRLYLTSIVIGNDESINSQIHSHVLKVFKAMKYIHHNKFIIRGAGYTEIYVYEKISKKIKNSLDYCVETLNKFMDSLLVFPKSMLNSMFFSKSKTIKIVQILISKKLDIVFNCNSKFLKPISFNNIYDIFI